MRQKPRSLSVKEIVGYFLCFILAVLLSKVHFLTQEWEDFILSARFFGRGGVQYQEPVIVKIDEESIRSIGPWPWPRDIYVKALHKLDLEESAVIGMDLLFQKPELQNDLILAQALEEVETPVVLGTELELEFVKSFWRRRWSDKGEKPSLFPMAEKGYLNLIRDRDGLIRKWPLYSGTTQPSFAERLYQLATGKNPHTVRHGLMSFLGGVDSFPSVSFSRLLTGEYPDGFFRDKVVMIGVTGNNMDRHGIALPALSSISGVYLHAYLFRNLIEKSWIRYIPDRIFIPILLGLSLCWAVLYRKRVGSFLLFLAFGVSVFIFVIGIIIGFFGYILPIISIIGLFVFESVFILMRSYRKELAERRKMKAVFSRYVSPQILEEIIRKRNELNIKGERRFVAVVFADLRNFMQFAEGREPEEVVSCISQVLGKMAEIIMHYGGLVDKFLGDGLLAVFGFPEWKEETFEQVFTACREMVASGIIPAGGGIPNGNEFAIGIGLSWGSVVAGTVGNADRMEYTVMGTPVNLASRLEKLAGPGEIVFPFDPGRIYPLVEGSYTFEQVRIKGMSNPITVARVKGDEVRR